MARRQKRLSWQNATHTGGVSFWQGQKESNRPVLAAIEALTPRQVEDLLGPSRIMEMYYVKRDSSRLVGAADEFEL